MDKWNVAVEIYHELDTIRLWSRIASFAAKKNMQNLNANSYDLIFRDIEKRCREIAEKVEQLTSLFDKE